VAVKPNPALIRAYPCDKGKKSTPEFETCAPNSGVALILLQTAASGQQCQKLFEKFCAVRKPSLTDRILPALFRFADPFLAPAVHSL
jgi:hypothetical protein